MFVSVNRVKFLNGHASVYTGLVYKLVLTYTSVHKFPKCQKIRIKYNIIFRTKLATLTCREIIVVFAIFWVSCRYCTFCLFTPKPSLLFTEVSIGTLPSLCVHDVMAMYGELMANFV